MATVNGARALGQEESLGTLEIGKLADCVAVDLNHLNTQPVYDPVSTLVYSVQSQQVSHVWVDGKLNVENGELCSLDTAELIAKARSWANKIQ
jgi:5-methylthioadenosine/S-adenosylhomocysteine deaminase